MTREQIREEENARVEAGLCQVYNLASRMACKAIRREKGLSSTENESRNSEPENMTTARREFVGRARGYGRYKWRDYQKEKHSSE